ncbi:hypothetical protein TNCV_4581211 [Trichonephila clavipes]|nr:hypothetical protein TNCV_4581211 [Trichonephila clavipes]
MYLLWYTLSRGSKLQGPSPNRRNVALKNDPMLAADPFLIPPESMVPSAPLTLRDRRHLRWYLTFHTSMQLQREDFEPR